MRLIWIALLIALLPLRGWVGDAMALGMASGQHAPQAAAAMGHGNGPCPHADASDAATTHMAPQDAAHPADPQGSHDHRLCDVCNAPALQMALSTLPVSDVVATPLAVHRVRYASLAPRRHLKPPIA
ncbi:MAG: hypothetical protein KF871_11110 [Hydrogenophaga sp.]|uniref:DUF2946 family protein n=1 Tax=Hydrogenophaga sp. TaxID=1904254 RepID=UPI001D4BF86F|nr:DUF2946 family protein [Hydrogenophaga sp.]MBX3610432.1 hypothetical protein [Hydrogenophaga sp.]